MGGAGDTRVSPSPVSRTKGAIVSAREDLIDFVLQYGGRCRDCADEAGFCPQTGIGCGQRRKAVEFVLGAIEYGVKHGFVSGYTIIRDDEFHKGTVERCIAVAEAERKKHDTGSGFDNQPAHAAAFAIRSRLRSLIKEDGE